MSFSVSAVFKPSPRLGAVIDSAVRPAVMAAVQQSCELIQSVEQAYCPVDTGALQASITIDPIQDNGTVITGTVGPHMDYAEYVEYGTGRRGDPSAPYGHVESWPGQAAQPYVRPAIDENKDNVLDIFKEQLAEALS